MTLKKLFAMIAVILIVVPVIADEPDLSFPGRVYGRYYYKFNSESSRWEYRSNPNSGRWTVDTDVPPNLESGFAYLHGRYGGRVSGGTGFVGPTGELPPNADVSYNSLVAVRLRSTYQIPEPATPAARAQGQLPVSSVTLPPPLNAGVETERQIVILTARAEQQERDTITYRLQSEEAETQLATQQEYLARLHADGAASTAIQSQQRTIDRIIAARDQALVNQKQAALNVGTLRGQVNILRREQENAQVAPSAPTVPAATAPEAPAPAQPAAAPAAPAVAAQPSATAQTPVTAAPAVPAATAPEAPAPAQSGTASTTTPATQSTAGSTTVAPTPASDTGVSKAISAAYTASHATIAAINVRDSPTVFVARLEAERDALRKNDEAVREIDVVLGRTDISDDQKRRLTEFRNALTRDRHAIEQAQAARARQQAAAAGGGAQAQPQPPPPAALGLAFPQESTELQSTIEGNIQTIVTINLEIRTLISQRSRATGAEATRLQGEIDVRTRQRGQLETQSSRMRTELARRATSQQLPGAGAGAGAPQAAAPSPEEPSRPDLRKSSTDRVIDNYAIDAEGNIRRVIYSEEGTVFTSLGTVSSEDRVRALSALSTQSRADFASVEGKLNELTALQATNRDLKAERDRLNALTDTRSVARLNEITTSIDANTASIIAKETELQDASIGGQSVSSILNGVPPGSDPREVILAQINRDFQNARTVAANRVVDLERAAEEGDEEAELKSEKQREELANQVAENAALNRQVLGTLATERQARLDTIEDQIDTLERKPETDRTPEETQRLEDLRREQTDVKTKLSNAINRGETARLEEARALQQSAEAKFDQQNVALKVVSAMAALLKGYREFSGLAQLGNLFIGDEKLAEMRQEVDEAFCKTILLGGVDCWVSKICDGYIDSEPGGTALVARGPRGEALGVVSLQAEKSLPIIFVEAGKTIEQFQYKITYSLTNPLEKQMSYNVEFSGEGKSVKAFGEDKIIPDGASDGRLGGDALIPPISTTNYNQVCLVWNPKITSFDGKQEGRFCVPISQYEGAATRPFAEENATVPGAPGANAVTIQNFRFSPNIMTINVGDSITWTNQDDALHTVSTTDGPESFDSGNLAKGQTFRKTFTKAGSYSYQCNNHPSMKGSITVKESGAAPGAPPAPAPKREDFSGF